MTCDHPEPLLCEQLGLHIHGRLYEIWKGTASGLTEAQCEEYRRYWISQAGALQVQPAKMPRCQYLWKRVRDADGKPLQRACG